MSNPEHSEHDEHGGETAGERDAGRELRELGREDDAERERLTHAEMRARVGAALFGEAEPVRLGRFILLDRLGQGGMGVVYSAYDPELDRRVALKLLRSDLSTGDQHARDRLLREAQALARLSHPNVVPVHDVGVIDDQVFVVMEFVVGSSLDHWVRDAERDWREVLSVYRQAGRGLAAAHAAGMVHRDFKPSNVLLGEDGRVRVLDFGLARGHELASRTAAADQPESKAEAEDEADDTRPRGRHADSAVSGFTATVPAPDRPVEVSSSQGRLHQPLTQTGAFLGTPAYMSPEQFMGRQVGPASDQFSFCVSLYEALYGQSPFAGDTLAELGASVTAGTVRPEPRGSQVPGWLYPVVCRGLAPSADARYPSMDALLAALGRNPARTRRRVLAGVAVAGLAALSIFSLLQRPETAAVVPCQGGGEEIAKVWNADRRAAVAQRITATGHPYAEQAIPRVLGGLDSYASAWADMHRDACLAHRRGEQSGELLDRRMACLGERKNGLASAIAVLEQTSSELIPNTVLVVDKLPGLEHCGNLQALAADVPPPEDPETAERVAALRRELAQAKALEDHGELTAALTRADAVVGESHAIAYQPLTAEALLLQGRIILNGKTGSESIEPLREAMLAGIATGQNTVAAEALARLIYAVGITSEKEPLASLSLGQALVQQVPEPGFVHALLLNNAGAARMGSGDREDARALFEEALEVKQHSPQGDHIELLGIHINLAMVTDDGDRRAAVLRDALDELERKLGATHPRALELQLMYGGFTLDPRAARAILEPVCTAYMDYGNVLLIPRALCLWELALLALDLENDKASVTELERLVALLPSDSGRTLPHELNARGFAALMRGDPAAARAALVEAIESMGDAQPAPWWQRENGAQAHLGLGLSALALGEHAEAARHLERALPVFEEVSRIARNSGRLRQLAWTWSALATALWDRPGRTPSQTAAERERALELITRAETWYRGAGPGYEPRLDALARWRRERGLDPDQHTESDSGAASGP